MIGTELKVIALAATEVLGPEVDRLATLHTNAKTDRDLLKVWLKSHADGSPHTVRAYQRVGERFIAALAARNHVEAAQMDGMHVSNGVTNSNFIGAIAMSVDPYTTDNCCSAEVRSRPREVLERTCACAPASDVAGFRGGQPRDGIGKAR